MNLISKTIAVAGLLTAGMLGSAALAQSGAEGTFTIYNDTAGNVVVGFYTNDGTGWSNNWLGDHMMPGQSASAEFFAETGSCDQLFQVGWLGDDGSEVMDEPISIDICQATNVYLGDNEIKFD